MPFDFFQLSMKILRSRNEGGGSLYGMVRRGSARKTSHVLMPLGFVR